MFAKKNRVTVRWKKINKTGKTKALYNQIKSVQIQYSTDPFFPKEATITKTAKKTRTWRVIKSLKRKTVYYFRVRYADGSGGYSNWSKVMKARTK